jgi:predicted nucleic acid-binding protein
LSLLYVDTSAFLKLFVSEPGSGPMLELSLANPNNLASSDLLIAETIGTLNRRALDVSHARAALKAVHLMPIRRDTLDVAADLSKFGLRTLDGIHLATALSVKSNIDAFITFDHKLAEVAQQFGLNVIEPAEA